MCNLEMQEAVKNFSGGSRIFAKPFLTKQGMIQATISLPID